jgi:hypothetical protein
MASQTIFCLLNCFNNYEMVSEALIKMYISNAISQLKPGTPFTIQSLTDSTPYLLYATYLNLPALFPGLSKQYQDYITIMGLASVVIARVYNCAMAVYARQDMIDLPGFSTMLTIANTLNKPVAMWTDDLRNLWGTSDDPLVIGMSPLPYRYLWTAGTKAGQTHELSTQPHGLDGYLTPALAQTDDICPKASICDLEQCWNTFVMLFTQASTIQAENKAGTLSQRQMNMVTLGNAIITYVETGKDAKWGRGWALSTDPTKGNTTLWADLQFVIKGHLSLLYTSEQTFVQKNMIPPTPSALEAMRSTPMPTKNPFFPLESNGNLARAFNEGLLLAARGGKMKSM